MCVSVCVCTDHLMMNSEMFMKWVQGRLMPTFQALYGPGTELGGELGKKMVVIMGKCSLHSAIVA